MPNGGSNNCVRCTRNQAVQKADAIRREPKEKQTEEFFNLSYCELHDVRIGGPFGTYCRYRSISDPPFPASDATAALAMAKSDDENTPQPLVGTIWQHFVGHTYIPWHGKEEPETVACVCTVCGEKSNEGVGVIDDGKQIGFCGNEHYVDWWKTKHDDPYILADKYGIRYLDDDSIHKQIRSRNTKQNLILILPGIAIVFVLVIAGISLSKLF